jgi:hypothetical protein
LVIEREEMMRKALILIVGLILCAALAVAAGDIPTRYSGSFPSINMAKYSITKIVGTYTGKRLAFNAQATKGGKTLPASASYSCSQASATETRCVGTFRVEGRESRSSELVVGWQAGRPISMSFSKN